MSYYFADSSSASVPVSEASTISAKNTKPYPKIVSVEQKQRRTRKKIEKKKIKKKRIDAFFMT